MESPGKPTGPLAPGGAATLPRFATEASRAVASHLFDTGGGLPEDRIAWWLQDVADFVGRAGWKTRTFFLTALFFVEWIAPSVFLRRAARFSRLPVEAQLLCLERLELSPLSGLLLLAKAMLGLVYFEHPAVMDEIGYDQRPLVVLGEENGR